MEIVIIGGGTGTFTVLSGLKKYFHNLSAVVTVADSGGSTGRLRDEFGYLPVGDFRMALVALAEDDSILRELFLYRFGRGETGLRGHNFGNLFLTALTDLLGSEAKAFDYASKILRVNGKILPITDSDVTLIAEYDDGSIVFGETHIDEPNDHHDGKLGITNLKIQPNTRISKSTEECIRDADLIVLGPGDLYTSILANVVVDGAGDALKKSGAKLVYVVNLMTKYGQTYDFGARDHVEEIKKYIGRYPDYVLINKRQLPKRILKKYKEENDFPVIDDLPVKPKYKVIREDLLAEKEIEKASGDVVKRSLIRHDPDKLAAVLNKLSKY